jgi:dimethylhistidine N-methyltransferase
MKETAAMWQQWQAGSELIEDISEQQRAFRDAVFAGLSALPKTTPCKYLYDDAGSRLFERITELDAYYPTRTELQILQANAAGISALFPDDYRLIELGSGSGKKTRALLDALSHKQGTFIPVDICKQHLLTSAASLAAAYPHVRVQPLAADYERDLGFSGARASIVFFPGSTLGNFHPTEACAFLARLAQIAGKKGAVLVGIDLKKDPALLHRAYNDEDGVTAAFNLNLLARMNRELDADFHLAKFYHYACYQPQLSRIEMHLVSSVRQQVTVFGRSFVFDEGESLRTECSYKYGEQEFSTLARAAGLATERCFTDEARKFAVFYLTSLRARACDALDA